MDQERWQQIESIFEAVTRLEVTARTEALERLCGSDDELRRSVAELLTADAGEGLLDIQNPQEAEARGLLAADSQVGAYRIVDVLGEGGSSTVYRAVRADLQYEQEVAVKVLRGASFGPHGAERFRRERQILADLDHPAIARLLDGGAVHTAPYLVMEMVDGVPITEYCTATKLPLSRRLELFLEVLDAVQYAHRRLIVHRDLKPSNILVRQDGQPKLLDFGIAKLLDPEAHRLGGEPTRSDMLLMTPSFASPEQLRGQAVTTASDVYSLGVVLYQLLTGRRPYEVDSADLGAMIEVVCEREPPLPSRAAPKQHRSLKGDIDHIVAKALAKDSERRYPGANAFAADIHRYLNGEPVEARAAGLGYRLGKLVRKHRWPVAVAATIAALLVAFAVSVGIQARQTAAALKVAEAEHEKADAVNDLLLQLLTAVDPSEVGGRRNITLLEAVRRTEQLIDNTLLGQPGVEGTVRRVLGAGYRTLGELDHAKTLLHQALELQERTDDNEEMVTTRTELARVLLAQGDSSAAEKILRTALDTIGEGSASPPRELASSWPTILAAASLGEVIVELGQLEEGEAWYTAAVSAAQQTSGNADASWAELLTIGSRLANVSADLKTSGERADTALEHCRRAFGDASIPVARALLQQGLARYYLGRYTEAEASHAEARRLAMELLGPEHPLVADATLHLGVALRVQNRDEEAEKLYREALAIRRKVSGNNHVETAQVLVSLSHLYLRQRRSADAGPLLEEALAIVRPAFGDDHLRTMQVLDPLARVYELEGDLEGAEKLQRQVLASRLRMHGEDHILVSYSRGQLAAFLLANGRPAEAEPLFRQAVSFLRQEVEPGDIVLAETTWGLGRSLFELGQLTESVEVLERAASDSPKLMRESWRYCGHIASNLVQGYEKLGQSEQAASWRGRQEACPRRSDSSSEGR